MTTAPIDPPPTDAPDEEIQPHDFAAELARQVYADLNGVLFAGDNVADDALAAVRAAAVAAQPRSAGLWLLLRAALAAFRGLRHGVTESWTEPREEDCLDTLRHLVPDAGGDAAAWAGRGQRLAAAISAAETGREPPHAALAGAIYRLYDGLRNEDEARSGSGLLELRTLLAHIDAAAGLDADTLEPVWRPDQFHDDFLRYVAAAQAGCADVQQPVATLSQDGRITALVTRDVHPVEHARQAAEEHRPGIGRRIEALLDFLQGLRETPDPLGQAAARDEGVFAALITAAATAPLAGGAPFRYAALGQITRYNLRLLQAAARSPQQTH